MVAELSAARAEEGTSDPRLRSRSLAGVTPGRPGRRKSPESRPRATSTAETSRVASVGRPGASARVGAGFSRGCRRRRSSSRTTSSPSPVDELHDVVVQAVLLADAEDRHDVGVVQLGRRPRLALEAAQLPRVEQGVAGQHLDGHVPAQGELLRLVDDPHAAAAHLPQDLVIPQLPQRRRGRGRLRR